MNVQYFFVKDRVNTVDLDIQHYPAKKMMAD